MPCHDGCRGWRSPVSFLSSPGTLLPFLPPHHKRKPAKLRIIPSLPLYPARASPLDLEVTGDLLGLPQGSARYIQGEDLLKLPQVKYAGATDGNLTVPAEVSGVPLEELARRLNANTESTLMIAISSDRYHAYYPHSYITSHHPILVLTINGKSPEEWPKDAEGLGLSLGPYLIYQNRFTASFKVLSQAEAPQIPWAVVRLDFRNEREVLQAIAPLGPRANDDSVQAGYQHRAAKLFSLPQYGPGRRHQSRQALACPRRMGRRRAGILLCVCSRSQVEECQRGDARQSELRRCHHQRFDFLLPNLRRAGETMTLRAAKMSLVFGAALYLTVVVFTNLTDYEPNLEMVRHVLMMDSTFVDGHSMWRALNAPAWHVAFYGAIVVWELTAAILCWWGGFRLAIALKKDASAFRQAKKLAIAGLTLNLLMWLVAFLTVGGEWFLMWQSKVWNGQQSAFRMFTVVGIILLLLVQPEAEEENRP